MIRKEMQFRQNYDRQVILWIDGGTLITNPGLGYGSYAFDNYKVKTEYGVRMTSNESEYASLIEGLNAVIQEYGNVQDTFIVIRTDSRLVQNQVTGQWGINAPNLMWLHYVAQMLLGNFAGQQIEWVPREQVVEALGH